MGFAKPIEQYLFGNLLTKMHVFMYLKDIIRGAIQMSNLENYMKQQAIFCEQNDSISKNLVFRVWCKKRLTR